MVLQPPPQLEVVRGHTLEWVVRHGELLGPGGRLAGGDLPARFAIVLGSLDAGVHAWPYLGVVGPGPHSLDTAFSRCTHLKAPSYGLHLPRTFVTLEPLD